MDNSSIIATITVVGSFFTVLVTSSVTMWGKWVDSNQKTNDHKLGIRSAYVNKKIEAGQGFINENNVRIFNKLLLRQYFVSFIKSSEPDNGSLETWLAANKVLLEMNLDKNNSTALFFDTYTLYEQSFSIMDEVNDILFKVQTPAYRLDTEDFKNEIQKSISLVDQVLNIYKQMNKAVREDLAKYDIL